MHTAPPAVAHFGVGCTGFAGSESVQKHSQLSAPGARACWLCLSGLQTASVDPGRRVAPRPAAAAAATGAGVPPATSPTRPPRHRRCPLTAPNPSAAPLPMTASTRLRPATCSSTSPSPGKERSASAPRSWSLTAHNKSRVLIGDKATKCGHVSYKLVCSGTHQPLWVKLQPGVGVDIGAAAYPVK